MPSLPHIEQQRRDRALFSRVGYIACVVILGFTGISARLYHLQARQHDALTTEAAKLRSDRLVLQAKRGSISDRNGELLAQDRTVYELYANVKHLADPLHVRSRLAALRGLEIPALVRSMSEQDIVAQYHDYVVKTVADRMGVPPSEVEAKLQAKVLVHSKDNDPAKDKLVEMTEPPLLKDLEKEEADTWQQLLDDKKMRVTGIYLRSSVKRFYPAGDRLSHVMGMVTFEKKGNEGVEQLLDKHLRGQDGWETIERDATRQRILPGFSGTRQEPRNGMQAVLTIDMTLQHLLEERLLLAHKEYNTEKAMGVLIDPITGDILAMASVPLIQQQRDQKTGELIPDAWERRNMAVTDLVEPGSTMKILTLAAALDVGCVGIDWDIDCHNGYYSEPANEVELSDDHSFSSLTVRNVLVHSSNIGAYQIAKRLGDNRFHNYIGRFGLGSISGLGLPRESKGKVYPLDWKGPSLSRIAMGYQVSATPLQLAMAVGAIANKGKLMKPRLVSRLVTPDGQHQQLLPPQMVHEACKPETARKITEALVGVVKEGTGKQAAIDGIDVAGKTGTAQRYNPYARGKQPKYPPGQYVTSFIGFAPAQAPRVVCAIILDYPKCEDHSMLYGGKLSAPIFKDIVSATLTHLDARAEHKP